jgi:hypothetical protein
VLQPAPLSFERELKSPQYLERINIHVIAINLAVASVCYKTGEIRKE